MLLRKSSLLSNIPNVEYDEDKLIEEALTTPYEKVIKILAKVKKHLADTNQISLAADISWSIDRIQSRTLYNYEALTDQTSDLERISKQSEEVMSFVNYLKDYSQPPNFQRKGRLDTKFSKTMKEPEVLNKELFLKLGAQNIRRSEKSVIGFLKRQDSTNEIMEPSIDLLNNSNSIEHIIQKKNSLMSGDKFDYLKDMNIFVPSINEEDIMSKDFNIFNFEKELGRKNVLLIVARVLFENLSLNLDDFSLENFLFKVRDGYKDTNPYHNSMHGVDVCHNFAMMYINSNLDQYLHMTHIDLVSTVIACLVHDIGHPGTTNGFQINSGAEIAITYNDKSVLENLHAAQTFMILRNADCNIFKNYVPEDYKLIRRRVIESVLSTDMTLHCKVVSLFKNRLSISDIKTSEEIVKTSSANLFEDQQEVINFLVHAADIGHCSKKFEISSKWTFLVSEEFWLQGDQEKKLGLQVSNFCDREKANIPVSQIGFIKGIIIPTYDLIVEFLPTLNYLKENVENNLNEWGKLIPE
jgi:hypothetical protein